MPQFSDKDRIFMQRALELAELGRVSVSPNPMVGCVVVHNDMIIGEGWHRKYGESHAEVNAISIVEDKSLLEECTVYVTLEPCSHYGKTPPCSDLLIEKKVKKVIVATQDSNPLVGGKGIAKLKETGIEVELGLMKEEASKLNRRFFTAINKKRPYIILKWAQTHDAFIAREDYDSKWISNDYSRKLVHKWRTEEDAIMVGTNTARYDNPQLNARQWQGKNPVRIVLDKNLSLNQDLNLFDGSQPTLCYNLLKSEKNGVDYIQIREETVLQQIMDDLNDRHIQSIIVEGGAHLLNSFIEKNLWDEARIFTAPVTFGKGINAPNVTGKVQSVEFIDQDELKIIINEQNQFQ